MIVAAAIGYLALRVIARTMRPERPATGIDLLRIAGLGAAIALLMVALDLIVPFPAAINARLPDALAFYPAIGFFAEVVLHLIPLAVVCFIQGPRGVTHPALILVAAIEPLVQAVFGPWDIIQTPVMLALLMGFGLFQVMTFCTYGFAAMYAARMGYYLVWHILWGTARLPLLF